MGAFQLLWVVLLSKPYPPVGHWVYESDEIRDRWIYWITKALQADLRKKCLPMLKLDIGKLAHDIGEDTSMIFWNKDGTLVGLVIRNFCESNEVLVWLDAIIERATSRRKSIQVHLYFASAKYLVSIRCDAVGGPRGVSPDRIFRRILKLSCLRLG